MALNSLHEIHTRPHGKLRDKWLSYLPFYDFIFSQLRQDQVRLLEIGIQNGGSLETWLEYFPNCQSLIGVDIDSRCGNLTYQSDKVSVVIGDATAKETQQRVLSICSEFDIVIDDGSHISNDVLISFLRYFPNLKPGGVYVVEDAHSFYWSKYGGGILNEVSAAAFFKKLVDVINFQFWRKDLSLDMFFREFFPLGTLPDFLSRGWIEAIEFRNSLVIIRKSIAPDHDKLGDRVIGGKEALVDPTPLKARGTRIG